MLYRQTVESHTLGTNITHCVIVVAIMTHDVSSANRTLICASRTKELTTPNIDRIATLYTHTPISLESLRARILTCKKNKIMKNVMKIIKASD